MMFNEIHEKILAEENKESSVDGRRFNRRSRLKMEREAQAIRKSIEKSKRKRSCKRSRRGVFSEEEIQQGLEAKKIFRKEIENQRKLLSNE